MKYKDKLYSYKNTYTNVNEIVAYYDIHMEYQTSCKYAARRIKSSMPVTLMTNCLEEKKTQKTHQKQTKNIASSMTVKYDFVFLSCN
jgi:hypothetical protein